MADYALAGDLLHVATFEFRDDGGVDSRDAGFLADAGLEDVWTSANAWCLSSTQFSMADDCFTHDRGLVLGVSDATQTVEFDYYRGSGLKPPPGVEAAVEKMLKVSTDVAMDAGAW